MFRHDPHCSQLGEMDISAVASAKCLCAFGNTEVDISDWDQYISVLDGSYVGDAVSGLLQERDEKVTRAFRAKPCHWAYNRERLREG